MEGFRRSVEKEIEGVRAENRELNLRYKARLEEAARKDAANPAERFSLKKFWEGWTGRRRLETS